MLFEACHVVWRTARHTVVDVEDSFTARFHFFKLANPTNGCPFFYGVIVRSLLMTDA